MALQSWPGRPSGRHGRALRPHRRRLGTARRRATRRDLRLFSVFNTAGASVLPDNTATNIRWLALVTGGEGLHNNHHGFPRSPKFSLRAGEIDPSWPIIQLLTRMKLAHPCRTIEEKAIGFRPDSPAVEL